MRNVVASLFVLMLISSFVLLSGQSDQTVVRAQEAAPPQLKRIRPATITSGAPMFTIRLEGKKFSQGARVLLDGVPLDSSRVTQNGKVLLAEVDPAVVASEGMHTLQALNSDGQTSETRTLTVVAPDPDLHFQLLGNAAQEDVGGLISEATGEGFNENTDVQVWGKNSSQVEVSSSERLRFVIASEFLNNVARIPVMVRRGNGRLSNVDIFFVVARPPLLHAVNPDVIEVGTEDFEIRAVGENFKPDSKLVVNNQVLELTRMREGRLDAVVPAALRAQPGLISVRVEQDGIQTINRTIQVTPTDDPFIFSITPALIRQGDNREKIELVGANFGNDVKVFLDGQEVKVRDSTRRRLSIVIKGDLLATPGMHTLQVRDSNGIDSNLFTFEVVPDVDVATLAGTSRDGFNPDCVSADVALLRRPRRLAMGPDGLIYVTDQQNHAIRTINPDTGEVCLIAGTGISGYSDSGNSRGFDPSFSFPNGLAVASDGTIYVTENGNNVIRRITRGAGGSVTVETFAGASQEIPNRDRQDKLNSTRLGLSGFRNGEASQAAFRRPDDILIAPDGSLYVVDANNHSIRRIRQSGGQVTVETIAGNGVPGYADGTGEHVRFNTPTAIALSDDGRFLFVADTNNGRIRRI
ncbi:MAG TPA: hypothetical protein VNO14_14490, partial [Blastocatellia bacterium]|nr:hypothetical protein [Blastocatellia bacterium]